MASPGSGCAAAEHESEAAPELSLCFARAFSTGTSLLLGLWWFYQSTEAGLELCLYRKAKFINLFFPLLWGLKPWLHLY